VAVQGIQSHNVAHVQGIEPIADTFGMLAPLGVAPVQAVVCKEMMPDRRDVWAACVVPEVRVPRKIT